MTVLYALFNKSHCVNFGTALTGDHLAGGVVAVPVDHKIHVRGEDYAHDDFGVALYKSHCVDVGVGSDRKSLF